MEVGDYTYGHTHIKIHRWGDKHILKIGKFCSIAVGCTVFLGGNHRHDWYTTYPFGHINTHIFPHHGIGHPQSNGNVEIGNDVWIGANVTILSGVKIGDCAIIGTCSLVTKNVEPYTIIGGNPAKLIRPRFSHDNIQFLLEIKWWDLPIDKIKQIVPLLCTEPSIETQIEIRKKIDDS